MFKMIPNINKIQFVCSIRGNYFEATLVEKKEEKIYYLCR